MLNCIATISVNGPLRAKLRAIADAGFEHVEIFESDLLASPESVPVIGAMMRDLGLTCVAFQPFRDFEGMPQAMRSRVFDRAERKFDVLQELGTDLMLVSSNVSPEALGDRGRMIDDFRELGERAAARGLRVGFEALAWARHIRDHRDAWEIVRQADHPAVGLALDAFNSLAPGIPIDSLEAILPENVSPAHHRSSSPAQARREDRELLRRYHDEGDTSAREELIQRHLPLVRSLARRYSGRGESLEDIEQVGAIGLIKAIDRFELSRDVSLATYATPNVVGEIKRHFRDKGWAIRVPRALQELNASMSGAIERLTGKLARSPSIAEIAEELKTTPEEVLEAMEVGSAYSTVSLSTGPSGEEELDPLETIGEEDQGYERSEDRVALEPALDRLPDAGARDPPDAVRGGASADPDRPGGGPLADARLAPDPQVARRDARGAHLRAGLRRTARIASPVLLALALGGCPGGDGRRGQRARGGDERRWRSAGAPVRARPGAGPCRRGRAPSRSGRSTRRRSPTGAPRAREGTERGAGGGGRACPRPRATGGPTRCGCATACTSRTAAPVRASDVEHSILRARALGPVGRRLFAGVASTSQRRRARARSGWCCGVRTRRSRTPWPRCRRGWSRRPPRCGRSRARPPRGHRPVPHRARRGPGARFVLTPQPRLQPAGRSGRAARRDRGDVGGSAPAADGGGDRRHGST